MSAEDATKASDLRLVSGPSALGGGSRRFFDLLFLMATTDFKKAFFGTALGYAWSLLRPLLLFGVLLAVFTQVFRLGSDTIQHYPVFLLTNIVVFTFFQESTMIATTSVAAREGIVRKTQFPRLVIPMSVVLTSSFNLGMNSIAVVAFALITGVTPMWTWFLVPLLLLVLFVLTSASATYLSALYVRRRDTAIIWTVAATALFYGSAVLYPVTIVPEGTLRDIMFCNPLVPLLVQIDKFFVDSGAPSAVEAAGSWVHLLPAVAVFVTVCIAAVWFFNREAPRVAEEL
ncbi:MAG: ABC transporter permease [Solirubrobacterales bacterium]